MGKSLKDWAEEYQYFSGKASEATRTLALGGIAVVWLFHNDDKDPNTPALETIFIWPVALLVFSLALDLLHYVAGAIIWYHFYLYHETNTPRKKRDNIEAENWKRDIVTTFFYGKIGVLFIAYIWLLIILFSKIF